MCCQCMVKTWNAAPAIALMIVVLWSYYAYVYEFCVLKLATNVIKQVIYLVVYHVLFLLYLIMYFLTMFHKWWRVPGEYYFSRDFYNQLQISRTEQVEEFMLKNFCREKRVQVYTRTTTGHIRYCHYCKLLKPDRTHHCSTCETCVIKMDHHCPWVNNCIGFTNYKYFVILVLYAGFYCLFYMTTTLEYSIKLLINFSTMKLREINIIAGTIVTLGLGIAVWVLFFYHVRLIFSNETTIEAMHPPKFANLRMSFDLGNRDNFYEHCGGNCCLWFLPVDTMQGNGVDFEIIRY